MGIFHSRINKSSIEGSGMRYLYRYNDTSGPIHKLTIDNGGKKGKINDIIIKRSKYVSNNTTVSYTYENHGAEYMLLISSYGHGHVTMYSRCEVNKKLQWKFIDLFYYGPA